MKNKFFLRGLASALLVASAGMSGATAAVSPRSVVVRHTDGTEVSVSLSGTLSLSFSDDALLITDAPAGIDVSIPRGSLDSFSLSDAEASLDCVQAGDAVAPAVTPLGVVIDGLADGAMVRVYGTDGSLRTECRASGGSLTLPLASFARGVNVVEFKGNAYKITVK